MSILHPKSTLIACIGILIGALLLLPSDTLVAQTSGPSPYRLVDDWAKLPDGRRMGAVGKVTMDPDGQHVWAVIRCDAFDPVVLVTNAWTRISTLSSSSTLMETWLKASGAGYSSGPMALTLVPMEAFG